MVVIIILIVLICVTIVIKIKPKEIEKTKSVELKNIDINSIIKIEKMESLQEIKQSELIEIKDSKVFGYVNKLVPSLFKTGVSANNVVNNQHLYKVIIPPGEKLAKSKDMIGAKRAFYHGENGIKGQANLVEANNATSIATNSVATVMNISSLIVGEYYMTQINNELSKINDNISKIENFQNNEYKSRVLALMIQIKKNALFQAEILESEELRREEIANLNKLEYECSQLLEQANETVLKAIEIDKLDFETYESKISEIQKWCNYQQNLIEILYRIVELNYTFHLGNKTKEQCGATFFECLLHSKVSRDKLHEWHKKHIETLGVDLNESTIKRAGFDGFIHKIPGMINVNFNYRAISKETTKMISEQIDAKQKEYKNDSINLFKQEVNIIVKDGKVFYLPENKEM